MTLRVRLFATALLCAMPLCGAAAQTTVAHHWTFETLDDTIGGLTGSSIAGSNYTLASDRYDEPYPGAGNALQMAHAGIGFTVALSGELDFNRDFAISYWVYNDRAGDGDERGIRVFDTLSGTASGIQLGTTSANALNLRLDDDDGGSVITNNVGAAPVTAENAWSHVAINYTDGATVEIFFDGLPVDSDQVDNLTGTLTATQAMQVGMINNGGNSGGAQRGAIDDLAFYNGTLDPQQIADLASGVLKPDDFETGDADGGQPGLAIGSFDWPALDPPAPTNVLFIIADDLTYTALGCYGNPHVQTPRLDELAARGLRFNAAYCQYPVCGPSRASLLSGLYPPTISNTGSGTALDSILGSNVTLPEHFKLNGYTTARISKLYHMRIPGDITSGSSGPDHAPSWSMTHNVLAPEWMSTGAVGHYTNETLNFDPDQHYNLGFGAAFYTVSTDTDGSEQADALAADKAVEWLDTMREDRFFLAVGLVRPHVPLVAPSSYFDALDPEGLTMPPRLPGDTSDIPSPGIFWNESSRGPNTDADRRAVLQAYYASVAFMDTQVGRILDKLDELNLTDNTVIVFTSDHGYHLGEHTMWQKLSLHQESAGVPLLIAGPGVNPGTTGSLAELIDLFPTLCDMADLETPGNVQGASLVPVFNDNDAVVNTEVFSKVSGGELLRTDRWAYMRYNGGGEELYDILADPQQYTNLALDPAHAATLQQMRGLLDAKLQSMVP